MRNRHWTDVMTRGVVALDLGVPEILFMTHVIKKQYTKSNWENYMVVFKPLSGGIAVEDGNNVVLETYDILTLPETVWGMVDDYGPDSEEGLVLTLLLPEEY